MNEIGRLFEKTKIVIGSRGVKGFFVAGKSYLYKNFPLLSESVQKTGDVLLVGKCNFDVSGLRDAGYICDNIDVEDFDRKYIDLYDVFCFGDNITTPQSPPLKGGEAMRLIEKYNKLIVDKDKLGNSGVLEYVEKNRKKKIVYVSSSTNISGGVMVIAEHLQQLQALGFNVTLISQDINMDMSWKKDFDMPVVHVGEVNNDIKGIDCAVATFWDTVSFVEQLNAVKKYYLVQNKEYLFYEKNNPFYEKAKNTYKNNDFEFLTISRWCQKWLKEDFDKDAIYIPNCIDTDLFNDSVNGVGVRDCFAYGDECDGARKDDERDDEIDCFARGDECDSECKDNRTRILIEGNPENEYKNVDESFEIVNKLDRKKFEVWFISYGGKSKKWYKYNQFFQKVPYYEMPAIYRSCDILLKTSKLESFSYPPLEMMACGGVCVVAENEGNSEYVKDEYNALTYVVGDIDKAINNIQKLIQDESLCDRLREGGFKTVCDRDLDKLNRELKIIFQ